jgi:hypothetical protein
MSKVRKSDKGLWKDSWKITRFASREDYEAGRPYQITEIEQGNCLLNVGINEMWNLIAGASANYFNEANTSIGVGDSSTAADPSQTDLLGVNKSYASMSGGYPVTGSNQKIVFRAVFAELKGNHDWAEFVVKQNTSGICLNRFVSDQGRKAEGQVWTVDLEITLS